MKFDKRLFLFLFVLAVIMFFNEYYTSYIFHRMVNAFAYDQLQYFFKNYVEGAIIMWGGVIYRILTHHDLSADPGAFFLQATDHFYRYPVFWNYVAVLVIILIILIIINIILLLYLYFKARKKQ